MAHAGGRPTKYNAKRIHQVDEYLALCVDEEFDWVKTDGQTSTTKEHRIRVNLPTVEGLSTFIGVSVDTLNEWAKVYPEFSASLRKVVKAQKEVVTKKALSGDYNPLIAKLILSANHGMREKSDVTTDGQALQVNIINYDASDSDTA